MSFSGILDTVIYGNTVAVWLAAAAICLLTMAGLWGAGRIVVDRLSALAARTSTELDDLAMELLEKTKFLFVLLVGVWAGSLTLTLSPGPRTPPP